MFAFPNFFEAFSTWLNVPYTPSPKDMGVIQKVSTNIDGVRVMCGNAQDPRSCSAPKPAGDPMAKQAYQTGKQVVVNQVTTSTVNDFAAPRVIARTATSGIGQLTKIITARDARAVPQPLSTHALPSWAGVGWKR